MSVVRIYETGEAKATVLRRRRWEEQEMPAQVLDGIERIFGERLPPAEAVARILASVREGGDAALAEWSARIDGAAAGQRLEIPASEWQAAYERLPEAERGALDLAAERIESFHRKQPAGSWVDVGPDGTLGQLVRPIERAGVYVPGGSAPLPSSLLMSAIPARVAGVREVVVCTPPGLAERRRGSDPWSPHPGPSVGRAVGRTGEERGAQAATAGIADLILAAAHRAEVQRLFAVGGAQAIAAMAYGTETVPAVDKIVGAGGLFITLAKRQVVGSVGIDGIYGPTETLLIADESANPAWAAGDLLAQAEHDVLASPLLLTPSRPFAEAVASQVASQLEGLSRAEIAAAALANRGGIVVTNGLAEAVDLANAYAPEHLCLLVADPWSLVGRIQNAGGIFVGEYSFEVLGDYVAGPSHVMPTEGSARYASPLSVADFVKRISLVALGPEAGAALARQAAVLARGEHLTAHAAAAEMRAAADRVDGPAGASTKWHEGSQSASRGDDPA